MHKYILIVFLFFVASLTSGNELKKLIDDGLEYSYNFNFTEAETKFKEAIVKFPDYPHGYHYLSQLYLWTFLGSKDSTAHEIFISLSDSAKIKGELLLEENDEDEYLNYLMGTIFSLRATSYSFEGSSLDAFWSVKSAVSYFEHTLELDPEFYDAYLGLGIFNYALSYVPGIFKWAVSLSGLSYDKELGLDYLRIAQKKGKIDKIEATFHLAKVYMDYIAEYDSAAVLLNKLILNHPNNSLFHYQYAVLKIRAKELEEAETSLNRVIKLNYKQFSQTNSLSYFLLGDINYKRNNFKEAIVNFKKFIKTTKSIDYTGIANYRMAESYAILDSIENSKKHLLLARIGNLDIPDDIYAHEKSEQYFIPGYSKNHIRIIQSKNYIDAGENARAYESLIVLIDSIKTYELKGMTYFYLSMAALNMGKYEEAVIYSNEADKIEYENEDWIRPFSKYIAAEAYFKLGNYLLSQEYLSIADDNNEYEFSEIIKAHVNNLARRLSLLKL